MSVLVAGGAGYIGSVTAELLSKLGHRVVVYDNLSRGHSDAVPKGAIFVKEDISNKDVLMAAFKEYGVDTVMYFAAHSLVDESMKKPDLYFQNNVVVGICMLDAMLQRNVRHLIFSSTCAVYGEPEKVPITEDHPTAPISTYGETKLIFERAGFWYSKIYGLRFTSLRYFNAAGASENCGEDHRPETHLIPITLDVALGVRPRLEIFGDDYPTPDGTCIRDYIHVSDLANAHILALADTGEKYRIYNLGSGHGYSVKEVLKTAEKVVGKSLPTHIAPRRAGDPPRLVADNKKINRELGWKPEKSLEDIIKDAWAWKKRFPNGYEK